MTEISGTQYRNLSQSEVVRIGGGKFYGLTANSHSSGKFKIYDGFDDALAVKASSTLTTSGIVAGKHAKAVLTNDGTDFADNEVVVIGALTYRMKNTLALAFDVKIGASVTATLASLRKAINGTGIAGTDYFAGTTAHPLVIATASDATTLTAYSRTYGVTNNSLATTETSAHNAWGGTTLGGAGNTAGVATVTGTFNINGTDYYFTTELQESVTGVAVANEILWVTNDATALDNMKLAINGTGVEGTDYSTGTNANSDVVATTNGNTTQVIEARVWGTLGNNITTTESMTTTAWTSTTLTGGVNGARLIMNEYTLPTGSSVVGLPAPINFVNGLFVQISSGTADLTVSYNEN